MRRIGIREFRDRATRHLAADEVLAVERHGRLTGYYVPVRGPDAGIGAAIARLREELRPRKAPLSQQLGRRRAEILSIAVRYGAGNVRVFGSVARGEESLRSDLDLLVNFEPGRSLLDLIGLAQELEQMLGHKVDVVSEEGLSPYLRDRILDEAIAL